MILLAAVLVLQPVLAEDVPLRLVASGVGDDEVVWTLDGIEVARTGDREAAVVEVAAGVHELRATTPAQGTWHALARPDGAGEGASFVPGWSATHERAEARGAQADWSGRLPPLPLALGAAAMVLLAWPNRNVGRRGLEALRRLRRR